VQKALAFRRELNQPCPYKILIQVSLGKGNRQIAQELFLSEYTVRNYVSSILSKLNLTSRIQIANYAHTREVD